MVNMFMHPTSPFIKDQAFAEWAFGYAWNDFMVYEADCMDLLNAWNKLHGDLMQVMPEDGIVESCDKMKAFYEEQQSKEAVHGKQATKTIDNRPIKRNRRKAKPPKSID